LNPPADEDEIQRTPENVPAALAWGLRAFAWIATSPWRFAAAQRLASIASRVVAPFSNWLRLPAFTGWGFSKDFPRPATRSFRERWSERSKWAVPPAAKGDAAYRQESAGRHLTDHPAVIQTPAPQTTSSPSDLFERFSAELSALGGSVIRCSSEDLPERVLALLQQKEIGAILAWEARCLPAG
jgi:hypothetical protein